MNDFVVDDEDGGKGSGGGGGGGELTFSDWKIDEMSS